MTLLEKIAEHMMFGIYFDLTRYLTAAGVLFVLGAQPAIVRATEFGLDTELSWQSTRYVKVISVKPLAIGTDKVFTKAMFRTVLYKIDSSISGYDFCLNQSQAIGTKTLSHSEVLMFTQYRQIRKAHESKTITGRKI